MSAYQEGGGDQRHEGDKAGVKAVLLVDADEDVDHIPVAFVDKDADRYAGGRGDNSGGQAEALDQALQVGALDAGGTVHISGGVVITGVKSAEPIWIGSAEKKPIITGGNVILDNNGSITAVNSAGEELVLYRMKGAPSYNENITTIEGSYTYRAQRDERSGDLCVYVPERVRERIARNMAMNTAAQDNNSFQMMSG